MKQIITIERTTQGYLCATILHNRRVKMQYIGYTKRAALQAFRAYLKTPKD